MLADYDEVRSRIHDGDILLCSGKGNFSKLIKKFTKSDWSHVAFVMWSKRFDRLMVLESKESKGVRSVPLSSYIRNVDGSGKGYNGRVHIYRDSRMIVTLNSSASDLNYKALGAFAIDHLGYPYDNDMIGTIMWRIISRKKKGKRKKDQEYICSEFAEECFSHIGIELEWNKRGFITPADFANSEYTKEIFELRIKK